MSEAASDLKRVASSSGFYAAGEFLSRGLAFILLPIYTRFLNPYEYGALELLNTFSGILFVFLLLGLPSAVTKCFHRDCDTPREQASVLTTALLLDLPMLLAAGTVLFVFAERIGALIIGLRAGASAPGWQGDLGQGAGAVLTRAREGESRQDSRTLRRIASAEADLSGSGLARKNLSVDRLVLRHHALGGEAVVEPFTGSLSQSVPESRVVDRNP